jgi:hypothetical protein
MFHYFSFFDPEIFFKNAPNSLSIGQWPGVDSVWGRQNLKPESGGVSVGVIVAVEVGGGGEKVLQPEIANQRRRTRNFFIM